MAQTAMSALELRNLVKNFGALRATDDLSLTIQEHELHAIIGPNGAGKSTLIGQMIGEITPDQGTISVFGTDITRWSVAERARGGLARSFQITQLCQGFSAEDNVALAVQAQQGHSFKFWKSARDERSLREPARAALNRVNMLPKAGHMVEELSHGEKRQLELAVALAMHPRILLLDEPMAGMGPEESGEIVALLASLKSSVTIVLIEHDMDAVFSLADRISVLVAGKIIKTGTADAVKSDPLVQQAYLGDEAAHA